MIDLGTLGGTVSAGRAISNKGVIAGDSGAGDGYYHAFKWNSTDGMQAIPGAEQGTHAFGINLGDLLFAQDELPAARALQETVLATSRHRIRSLLLTPVMVEGRCEAVLEVAAEHANEFNDDDTALLSTVAEQVAVGRVRSTVVLVSYGEYPGALGHRAPDPARILAAFHRAVDKLG